MKILLKTLANNREIRKLANQAFVVMIIIMFCVMLWMMAGLDTKLDEITDGLAEVRKLSIQE